MLLVDDDQPEPLDRSEHSRARTHTHARLPRAQPPPFLVALSRAQARVQHGDGLAEAFGEAPDDLRRQRYLGHEHDRATVLLQCTGGGAQVDLGLARSGDPLQQRPLEATRIERRAQTIQRIRLRWRELRRLGTA